MTIDDLINKREILACDTETTGLHVSNGCRPFAFSFTGEIESWKEDGTIIYGNRRYLRAEINPYTRELELDQPVYEKLVNMYSDKNKIYIFHNAKFDLHMLRSIGVEVMGEVWDTLTMAHILNNQRSTYKLKPLSKKIIGFSDDDEKDLKQSTIAGRRKGKKCHYLLGGEVEEDYWLADRELCKKYAIQDTDRCMLLFNYFRKQMREKDGLWAVPIFKMEMELLNVLYCMEKKGITIDGSKIQELKDYYNNIIDVGNKIKEDLGYGDLNTRSSKQMHKAFYDDLKAPPVYTITKKKDGTRERKLTANKKALGKWANKFPLAKAIVDINAAQHELGSFVAPIDKLRDEDSRIHPNYWQSGTVTGRLSCSDPNLQNISNVKEASNSRVNLRARELFVPAKDHVLYFPDYSQIEVWISAYTSKDIVMCEALANGLDMHENFNQKFYSNKDDFTKNKGLYRKQVKTGTFCTIYGGGKDALSATLGCSLKEAQDFLTMFRDTYYGLTQYGYDLSYVATELGYIENPFGRRVYLDPQIAYKALNYMVQGSASEVMKRALINIFNLCKKYPGVKLLLTIHDEVCLEVPLKLHSKKLMRDVIKAMQGDFHIPFVMPRPFDVSMAFTKTNWAEKEEIEI